ncbi:GldG family protein [Sporosalibacterium faouarense]|uniref:GldG family protein n=1 Tax=Sporosalibacterium faouarense TaxID=516123 RepID=UPI00192C927F|nr:GldG family protein [Sporosalibacterium faouarense]
MKKLFNMRRLKYGSNSIILTVSIVGIVILFNILISNYNMRIDMTQNKLHTLSDKTKQVLSNLDNDIEIIGFFTDDSDLLPQINELLKEYKHHSDDLTISLLDINSNPVKARQYDVTDYGTVVVKSGDRIVRIRRNDFYQMDFRTTENVFAGEEKITQAIVDVTTEKQNKAYFLQGHGELSGDSIHWFKSSVEGEGYIVDDLNMAQENGIPEDADLLIIPGPTKDFTSDELWYLTQYTDNGGRIMFLMRRVQDQASINGLLGYMRSLGVQVNNDLVIDPERNYFNDPITIIPEYKTQTIVNKLKQAGLYVILTDAISIEKSENIKDNTLYEPLLETSNKAWGETNLTADDINFDENDHEGPLTVAAAITKNGRQKAMKVVVIGNVAIATNELINEQGNMDFIVNAINFTQDKEELISIRTKNRVMEPLTIQGNQGTFLYVVLVGVIPLIIFAAGLIIFIRRRRR